MEVVWGTGCVGICRRILPISFSVFLQTGDEPLTVVRIRFIGFTFYKQISSESVKKPFSILNSPFSFFVRNFSPFDFSSGSSPLFNGKNLIEINLSLENSAYYMRLSRII